MKEILFNVFISLTLAFLDSRYVLAQSATIFLYEGASDSVQYVSGGVWIGRLIRIIKR